jgi:hypothetical protein
MALANFKEHFLFADETNEGQRLMKKCNMDLGYELVIQKSERRNEQHIPVLELQQPDDMLPRVSTL